MKLVVGALVALALLTLTGVAVAQTSELFLIWGPRYQPAIGETYVLQEGQLLRSWTHVGTGENGIAVVAGTVRQVAYIAGGEGAEYTLDGVPTGVTYSGAASVYDATSDGKHIYAWHWFDASVLQYDLDWQFQTTLFTLPPAFSKAFMGITYDATTNSIWLVPWGWDPSLYGYLYNYSLDGTLLGTVELDDPGAYGNGLALDPADDTFWFFSWSNEQLEQYSRNGVLLGTVLGLERIYGGEFHQPRTFSDGFESGDCTGWTMQWPPP